MLAQTIENCGRAPDHTSADSGYFSEANVTFVQAHGTEPLLATRRHKHGDTPICVRGRPPAGMTPKQRMARKLATKRGRALYSRRKVIVEPVFGQIKAARGIRDFLLRGVRKGAGRVGVHHRDAQPAQAASGSFLRSRNGGCRRVAASAGLWAGESAPAIHRPGLPASKIAKARPDGAPAARGHELGAASL